jgi:hypothetical protein
MKKCYICQNSLSADREEALNLLGTPEYLHSCVQCAEQTVKRKVAIYPNFSGHNFIIASDLGQDGIPKQTEYSRGEEIFRPIE